MCDPVVRAEAPPVRPRHHGAPGLPTAEPPDALVRTRKHFCDQKNQAQLANEVIQLLPFVGGGAAWRGEALWVVVRQGQGEVCKYLSAWGLCAGAVDVVV